MPSALIAESRFTAGKEENIAPMPVISQKGSGIDMSHEVLQREAIYQLVMHIFRFFFVQEALSYGDYTEAERMMRKKYNPALGTLFADISLT
jgi:hypothetical protein